jgi:mannose-6-phosphate isomerase-like protein (cupin superfamily)
MEQGQVDFGKVFADLAASGAREKTTPLGGVDVRLVRVPANVEGRWDSHPGDTETVVVWSGEFHVEFRDATLRLSKGQCCVVPAGAPHRATSPTGADVVLFKRTAE